MHLLKGRYFFILSIYLFIILVKPVPLWYKRILHCAYINFLFPTKMCSIDHAFRFHQFLSFLYIDVLLHLILVSYDRVCIFFSIFIHFHHWILKMASYNQRYYRINIRIYQFYSRVHAMKLLYTRIKLNLTLWLFVLHRSH